MQLRNTSRSKNQLRSAVSWYSCVIHQDQRINCVVQFRDAVAQYIKIKELITWYNYYLCNCIKKLHYAINSLILMYYATASRNCIMQLILWCIAQLHHETALRNWFFDVLHNCITKLHHATDSLIYCAAARGILRIIRLIWSIHPKKMDSDWSVCITRLTP